MLRSTEQTMNGNWNISNPARILLSDSQRDSALLKTGDLVMTKSSGSEIHIGKTSLVNSEIAELNCCFSNFMQRLRTSKALNPTLLWYLFNSAVGREQLIFHSTTTTGLGNLNREIIGLCVFPLPPLLEQRAIADYLDHQTSLMDALVAKKQRMIELLAERRQSLITHAVTKGLDPQAPMRQSGIQWIGEVPEHWEVARLKHCVAQFISGGTPKTDDPSYWSDDETGIPWVAINDMTRSHHVHSTAKRITPDGLSSKQLAILPAGTLLYSMYASIGKTALLQIDATVNQAILGIVVDNDRARRDFVGYWLEFMQQHVLMLSSSNTQENLNAEKVRGMKVVLPPID